MSFWFGEFELDQERRQLLRSGEPVPLEPKAYELLSLLVKRRPRALSRAQIRDAIWPQTFVSESTLAVVVNGIRQALEDDARHPRFIRTVHGFGYAFCGDAREPGEGRPAAVEAIERRPYPGLLAFTEADAEHFFGREAEVEALWEKIPRQKLLAVIGPSGVGKTSFLRAGVIPGRPAGWSAVYATPGTNPALALARALIPELAGQAEAIDALLQGVQELSLTGESDRVLSAVQAWRRKSSEALVVVDQFEELFALNAPEMQAHFASFLARLAEEAGIHVLFSLRDDFLFRCSEQETLRPVFHDLTPLTPPSADALRRAVAEPARREGYRFEDDALVEEMVASVEGVKAALPLLAFAVARLWEERNRGTKLLTREAYERIRGVPGALAQHAEATLAQLGPDREGMVREVFRNLVTAQGTRAVAGRAELLSVFGDRQEEAGAVLDALVDARLLTEFEAPDVEGHEAAPGHCRVEVVHESLLTHWPRLVRWRTQDADGAQLRDQLRQAARLWDERGRTADLLWTGTACREFDLWRDRYPGALTVVEADFARAMARKAKRERRRRQVMAGAVVAASLVVAVVTGVLWRRSEASRRDARGEALRAEAGKLLALGRTHLETDPTAALAYARGSLDLFETREARTFALEALWRGPIARILPVERMVRELRLPEDPSPIARLAVSPDGRWLATGSGSNRRILLFPRDGGPARALPRAPDGNTEVLAFGPRGDLLVTGGSGESLRFWALPDLREIRTAELGGLSSFGVTKGEGVFTFTRVHEGDPSFLVRAWPLPEGEPKVLGTLTLPESAWDIDPGGTTLAYFRGRTVRLRPLDPSRPPAERILGQGRDEVQDVTFSPKGDRVASLEKSGEIRVWSAAGAAAAPLRIFQGPRYEGILFLLFDPEGRLLTQPGPNNTVSLWDLDGPPDCQPVVLGRPGPGANLLGAFDPGGQWLTTSYAIDTIEFWSLATARARAIPGPSSTIWSMAFTSDSRWLATCALGQSARLWPLSAADGRARDLVPREPCVSLAVHPTSGEVLVGTTRGDSLLYPFQGGPPRRLPGGWGVTAMVGSVAFDPTGRRAVASPYSGGRGLKDPKQRVLRVWDVESGQERVYSVAHLTDADWDGASSLEFAPDGSLCGGLRGGDVVRLVLPADPGGDISSETVVAAGSSRSALSRDGRLLLVLASESTGTHNMRSEQLLLFDLARRTSRRITTHGTRLFKGEIDPSGRAIVTGDIDGVVRVGPVTGEEPHLLLGHEGMVTSLAISPDNRWIASATEESIRLWPMPDVTRPPLHTLPHAELMAKLDALTNLRVVRDPTSSTGWKLEVGPFPGWRDVPAW